jgi:cell wall-associated NlpC family hydrolase
MSKNQIKIDDLIGKDYKEKGRGPDYYDCYGLCMEVSNRFGMKLPELHDLIRHKFITLDKPEPGALVLIETENTRHIGIMIDKKSLLQVNSLGRRGVHKIRINHPWIKDRIVGYYKYVG